MTNALAAATGVLVPTLPAAADLRGLRLVLGTIGEVKALNPGLELAGVVVTRFTPRLGAHRDALEAIRAAGLSVLACIPESVRVQESAGAGVPLTEYDPNGKPAAAYRDLLKGITLWLNKNDRQ